MFQILVNLYKHSIICTHCLTILDSIGRHFYLHMSIHCMHKVHETIHLPRVPGSLITRSSRARILDYFWELLWNGNIIHQLHKHLSSNEFLTFCRFYLSFRHIHLSVRSQDQLRLAILHSHNSFIPPSVGSFDGVPWPS